jgi:hypothetical protein
LLVVVSTLVPRLWNILVWLLRYMLVGVLIQIPTMGKLFERVGGGHSNILRGRLESGKNNAR